MIISRRPLLASRLGCAGLLWLVLAVALGAADSEFEVGMVTGASAEIRLTVPGGRAPEGGFLPVRVRIANRAERERSWTLELGQQSQVRYGGMPLRPPLRSQHQFTVPAASTREFFIFVPVASTNNLGNGMPILGAIAGPEVARDHVALSLGYGWGGLNGPLAVEPALEESLRTAVALHDKASLRYTATSGPARRMRASPGGPSDFSLERVSVIDPAEWPADWRLWSSFPLVILQQSTWERLDSARRRALADWVVMGGRLALSPATPGDERRAAFGAGEIITLARPLAEAIPTSDVAMQRSPLNRISALVDAIFWELPEKQWDARPRVGWLTVFTIGFGVLVGPANFFWFAPSGRRHRLFYTVPLISLGAAGVLFTAIIMGDGFGGTGARRTLVVLVPEQNEAAVYQRQVSRTGLLVGRSFAFPSDALIERDGDPAGRGAVDEMLRTGDTASGSWFSSRTIQQHSLARLVPTRERVELVDAGTSGAGPVVQSTVGATLQDFFYRDDDNRLWYAAAVPPGTRVTLARAGSNAGTTRLGPIKVAPGAFLAAGGPGSLALRTLSAIRWTDDATVYTGHLVRRGVAP